MYEQNESIINENKNMNSLKIMPAVECLLCTIIFTSFQEHNIIFLFGYSWTVSCCNGIYPLFYRLLLYLHPKYLVSLSTFELWGYLCACCRDHFTWDWITHYLPHVFKEIYSFSHSILQLSIWLIHVYMIQTVPVW